MEYRRRKVGLKNLAKIIAPPGAIGVSTLHRWTKKLKFGQIEDGAIAATPEEITAITVYYLLIKKTPITHEKARQTAKKALALMKRREEKSRQWQGSRWPFVAVETTREGAECEVVKERPEEITKDGELRLHCLIDCHWLCHRVNMRLSRVGAD